MGQKKIEAIYPLSPSQQGILFEALSSSSAGLHVEQAVWDVPGLLNRTALQQAWQRVAQRHSSLRTAFVWKDRSEPLQVVLRTAEVPITWGVWRSLSPPDQQEELQAYLEKDRLHSFELSQAPLMRLAVFQNNQDAHQIVWTVHHIIIDGWSAALILGEVLALYNAFQAGQEYPLPPSRPYKDYITWLQRQNLRTAELFWRKRLEGFTRPTPLGVEVDPIHHVADSWRHLEQKASLSPSHTAALNSLLREHRLTLNALIQGVWALLLSRYSGESDVVFGTTVSGRPADLSGVETMTGLFINTLPVRVKVQPDARFWPWLLAIQADQLEQQPYEYCSAGQIHKWSQMPGSQPLFESLVVFQRYPVGPSTPQHSQLGMRVDNVLSVGAPTRHALSLLVMPNSELLLRTMCDSRRFDALAAARVLDHCLALLQSIVAMPNQPLTPLLKRIPADQIPKVSRMQRRAQPQAGFRAPGTAMESLIAGIWQELLGIEQVGVYDNFFDLGGHSLLAMEGIARLEKELGLRIDPSELLLQTLGQFAAACEERLRLKQGAEQTSAGGKL